MKSSYMILETELSPAEVDGLREVTRHAPAKSAISKKVRDRLVTLVISNKGSVVLCPLPKAFCILHVTEENIKSISPYPKSLRRGHSPFLAPENTLSNV